MNYSLVDAGGLLLSVASYIPLVVLPGVALAAGLDALGFRTARDRDRLFIAVVTGLAVLPAVDSLSARFGGLHTALVINGLAAVAALGLIWRKGHRPSISASALGLVTLWLVVLLAESVDFDIQGGLYQPFTAVDMVKHAATTQAIHDTGAPPYDPFFARPGRVSYYYFFYTLTALSQRFCGGLIDARAAVGGLIFWVALGLYGLATLLVRRAGFAAPVSDRRLQTIVLALLAASGLDIIFVLRMGLIQGFWLPDPTWWNDNVAGWLEGFLWVPHHVTALIAIFVGIIALAENLHVDRIKTIRAVGLAGLCFASAFGVSVWLTLAAVLTMALWLGALLIERRWRPAVILVLAGLVAVLIATPAILDLRTGRSDPIPIVASIRAFTPTDSAFPSEPLRSLVRLLALPFNYFAQFGVLFLGTLLFWRTHRLKAVHASELARVMTLAVIASLMLGTFLKSQYFHNNDLGWRVLMVPQLVGLVWTAAFVAKVLDGAPPDSVAWRRLPPLLPILAGLGYATTIYAMISLRAFSIMPMQESSALFKTDPVTARSLRAAYAWINLHLPAQAVLQHNPLRSKRVVAFGLYSRNPVGVSDLYGSLYGAGEAIVDERRGAVLPLFEREATGHDVKARATASGIDALVVTADDPIWADPASWVWKAIPLYDNKAVRIIPVQGLQP